MQAFTVITILLLALLYLIRLTKYRIKDEERTIFAFLSSLTYITIGLAYLSAILGFILFSPIDSIITLIIYTIIYLLYIYYKKKKCRLPK